MKNIDDRRSIRSFLDKNVEEEKINSILRAGMQAPSAGNQRPWEFVVVKNKAILKVLSEMSPYAKMVASAPLAIVMIARDERMVFPSMWQQDMGACAQNILLEVVEQGLGAVWLGVAPEEERMAYVLEAIDMKDVKPFAVIPLGYSDKANKFIDRYEEERVIVLD